jgi:DNA-binding MurR/RpiR family transcriptional regulator
MFNITLYERISQAFTSLPLAEQRVCSYLLHNGHAHADLSLDELASYVGVSKPVVVRMCQHLGYAGFRAFRLEWATQRGRFLPNTTSVPGFAEIFASLQQTADFLSPDTIDQAASIIRRARQFYIYASGGSSFIAELAAAAFSTIGRLAITFNEAVWRMPNTNFADADTAVLVISYRGANTMIKDVVERDRKRGARIIVLTSNPDSELAQVSDLILVTGCQVLDSRELEKTAARMVQLASIHALVKATAQQDMGS